MLEKTKEKLAKAQAAFWFIQQIDALRAEHPDRDFDAIVGGLTQEFLQRELSELKLSP
jgi:hypothetical protein